MKFAPFGGWVDRGGGEIVHPLYKVVNLLAGFGRKLGPKNGWWNFSGLQLFDLETCCFVFFGKIIARGLCSIPYLMNTRGTPLAWMYETHITQVCSFAWVHGYLFIHRCVSLALHFNVLTLTYNVSARLSTCMEALIQLDTGCQYSYTLALVWPSAYQTFSASNAYILDQWFLGLFQLTLVWGRFVCWVPTLRQRPCWKLKFRQRTNRKVGKIRAIVMLLWCCMDWNNIHELYPCFHMLYLEYWWLIRCSIRCKWPNPQ